MMGERWKRAFLYCRLVCAHRANYRWSEHSSPDWAHECLPRYVTCCSVLFGAFETFAGFATLLMLVRPRTVSLIYDIITFS